jgi:hypothetical protein
MGPDFIRLRSLLTSGKNIRIWIGSFIGRKISILLEGITPFWQ